MQNKKIRWDLVVIIALAFPLVQLGRDMLFAKLGFSTLFPTTKESLIFNGSTFLLALLIGLLIPFWEKKYAKDNALAASLLILIYIIFFNTSSVTGIIAWFIWIALPMFFGSILMSHFKNSNAETVPSQTNRSFFSGPFLIPLLAIVLLLGAHIYLISIQLSSSPGAYFAKLAQQSSGGINAKMPAVPTQPQTIPQKSESTVTANSLSPQDITTKSFLEEGLETGMTLQESVDFFNQQNQQQITLEKAKALVGESVPDQGVTQAPIVSPSDPNGVDSDFPACQGDSMDCFIKSMKNCSPIAITGDFPPSTNIHAIKVDLDKVNSYVVPDMCTVSVELNVGSRLNCNLLKGDYSGKELMSLVDYCQKHP
jgi:hypothetical protein